ncbi:MAG: AAA family ATPase [Deltaproteobacteria bacterium]|nr:AAA family ATPase [Deltaproteobacteria bacterium]MBW2532886.1 AAA family ATPase [Deltaproteobacteria bacterium]
MGDDARPAELVAYLTALCKTVPYHVVEAVLAEPTEHSIKDQSFEGSLMFADLVGFASLCERLASQGPEGLSALSGILNRLFRHLLEDALFPYRGYVVHFGGDSATVVFRGDDHARRCAAAALASQTLLSEKLGRIADAGGRELMLRIGIVSGVIRLPVFGDLVRRMIVCAGATSHRAVELQRQASPLQVLADRSTVELLGQDAQLADERPDRAVLTGLRSSPTRQAIVELGERVLDDVEDKIELLEPFVAPPLAHRLRSTPLGWRMDGELREPVIIFVELAGLDEHEEAFDSESVGNVSRSLLRAYRKYGGTTLKADLAEQGHRLMVVFGLHDPSDTDAERALMAALEASTRMRAFTIAEGFDVTVRTGVHTGKVFFGAIGSEYKHDITLVGDAVNVAARAASIADPFQVLATDDVLRDARSAFSTSTRGPVALKGKSVPLTLHSVHSAASGEAHYLRLRKQQRFCAGRDRESDLLQSIVRRALEGEGQIVGMVGKAGTGKSFLLANVVDEWIEAGGVGIHTRCRFATRSAPLAPFLTIVSTAFGISPNDDEATRRDRIRAALRRFKLGSAPELVALLQPVFRPDGTTEALVDLADPHSRERLMTSIARYVEQRVAQGPLLAIIEDLHQADSMTIELAMRLTSVERRAPFLFIGTYRPDPAVAELRRALDTEIGLENLTFEQATDVIRHEMRADDVDRDVAAFVWQRSEGNPEYLIECIRFLSQRNLLGVQAGVVTSSAATIRLLDEIVPKTPGQMVIARLERLGAVENRLLRMASVIGPRFGRPLLEAVTREEMGSSVVDRGLSVLLAQGFIGTEEEERDDYWFRDEVTRSVAYATIPEADRQTVHRRIANAIERLDASDPAFSPTTLALHRERADQTGEALRWYEVAVRDAMRAGLHREVGPLVDRWQQMRARLDPEQRPADSVGAEMAVFRLVALARSGAAAEVMRQGRRVIQSHWNALEPAQRQVVDFWLGDALISLGRSDIARERLERVFAAAEDPRLRSDAARLIARTYEWAHQPGEADRWLDRAGELVGDDPYRRALLDMARANIISQRGELHRATGIYQASLARGRKHGYLDIRAIATNNIAYCAMLERKFAHARLGFDAATRMFHAAGRWSAKANCLANLGQTFLWEGRPDDARPPLEKALGIAIDIGDESVAAEARVHLGAAIALSLDPREGVDVCTEGTEQAARSGDREVEMAGALHLLRLAILQGDPATARVARDRCRALEFPLAMPLFAQTMHELERQAAELLD